MGWIIAAAMAFIAFIAFGVIWRINQREVRRLRSSHIEKIHRIGEEHEKRLQRLRREYDQNLRSAHHPLALDLLPALDSLDEALLHFDRLSEEKRQANLELRQGIDLAREALDDAFSRHGVVPISPLPGEVFEPAIHEAISRNEDSRLPPGTVFRLLRRGYQDQYQVLRPALVEVNTGPRVQDSEDSPTFDPDSDPDEGSNPDEDSAFDDGNSSV